jgi:flavodoxin I
MGYIGLFYGTQTGNTELIAKKIQQELGEEIVDLFNVKDATAEDMAQYSILIMAAPTWYDGEMQADWEDFMPKLESIDFTDKYVGLVGLGDQVGYAQYFVDSIGVIAEAVNSRGAQVYGLWSRKGYEFEASKGLANDEQFWGTRARFRESTKFERLAHQAVVRTNSRRARHRRTSIIILGYSP